MKILVWEASRYGFLSTLKIGLPFSFQNAKMKRE
jgi:hypothetical protein